MVACEADIVAGTATAMSACMLGDMITNTDPVLTTGTADCPGATYEITYTVTDDCGRTADCVQTFTIANDDPTITCPADMPVACVDDIVEGTASFTTSCALGGVVTTSAPVLTSGMGDEPGSTYEITYTVTDDCGRTADCVQVFTIANDDPTITCPADDMVECEADIVIGTPQTSVACNFTPTVTTVGPTLVTGTADCPGATYEIEYTVTDDIGRTATCTQTLTIANDDPTITCPADAPVTCEADIVEGTPTFTTSCELGGVVTTVGPTLTTGTADCPGATYEIVYTVTDDCGRTADCTQIFTIENDDPTITCPADDPTVYTIEADIPPADITLPTVTSSCMLGTTITWDGDEVNPACPNADNQGTVIRTYTVTDDCGRTASCTQTFLFSCCDAVAGTLEPIDDICVGESVTGVVDGTQAPAPDYAYDYVLTDAAGAILDGPNATGMFTPTPAGDYCIYGISYQTATGAPDYSGGDINTITQPADCFEITSQCFTVTDPPTVTIGECAAGPAPTNVYTDLEGVYPDGQLGTLPDIYVFCEPGCVEATGADVYI